ncbi:hypothetical protein OF855_24610 [Mycolicibacterium fortuitum]|uniref:hypothetical protein n=1 Tax=Mycolicibacterium fortuitum TaxID=1766 RepID=UPI0022BA52F0|nr:hypothetical protein [Mycolicibacterium fortuitum]WAY18423.1 hypothetical protein OF855_24610 [Mycolicibacterium fortuitum]
MSDAQKLIREVLDEHQFNWGSSGTSCSGKACRDWRGYPMQHRQHLAAEIDKALGGLRKLNGHGQLLPGGILTPTYNAPGKSKTYTQWISGWSEVQS